eukprot:Phypoly_transcript_26590.p1 GENE.Phypoly_transcript_26590~~Phypoly_transcript_26590.p1  ORF type:complete len:105 (-),score=1.47 Phypoly_transcript_26590:48-362(-)
MYLFTNLEGQDNFPFLLYHLFSIYLSLPNWVYLGSMRNFQEFTADVRRPPPSVREPSFLGYYHIWCRFVFIRKFSRNSLPTFDTGDIFGNMMIGIMEEPPSSAS